MDYLTVALLVLLVALFVATLVLGWKLYTRPVLMQQGQRMVPAPKPAPTVFKCNTKHFIFKRTDETGAEVTHDVWRHPYCENLSDDALTDEAQAASFLGGHPGEGWQHVETRGEVHFVKA